MAFQELSRRCAPCFDSAVLTVWKASSVHAAIATKDATAPLTHSVAGGRRRLRHSLQHAREPISAMPRWPCACCIRAGAKDALSPRRYPAEQGLADPSGLLAEP